jgi:putative transposon-encoded protein
MDIEVRMVLQGEEVVEREVKRIGNSAHVMLPRSWIGAKVKVIRLKKDTQAEDGGEG